MPYRQYLVAGFIVSSVVYADSLFQVTILLVSGITRVVYTYVFCVECVGSIYFC